LHLQSIRWIPHLQFPPPLSFIYIFPFEHYMWLGVQMYASLLDDITSQPLAISMEDVLSTIPHQGLNHASFGPHSACILWIHVQTKLKNIKCALHNLKVFHIYILFPLSFESFMSSISIACSYSYLAIWSPVAGGNHFETKFITLEEWWRHSVAHKPKKVGLPLLFLYLLFLVLLLLSVPLSNLTFTFSYQVLIL